MRFQISTIAQLRRDTRFPASRQWSRREEQGGLAENQNEIREDPFRRIFGRPPPGVCPRLFICPLQRSFIGPGAAFPYLAAPPRAFHAGAPADAQLRKPRRYCRRMSSAAVGGIKSRAFTLYRAVRRRNLSAACFSRRGAQCVFAVARPGQTRTSLQPRVDYDNRHEIRYYAGFLGSLERGF